MEVADIYRIRRNQSERIKCIDGLSKDAGRMREELVPLPEVNDLDREDQDD